MLSHHDAPSAFEQLADAGCVVAGYSIARLLVRSLSKHDLFIYPPGYESAYGTLLVSALLLWPVASLYGGIYHSHRTERLSYSLWQSGRTLGLWSLLTIGSLFLIKLPNVSRQFVFYLLTCSSALILARQGITMIVLRRLRRFGYNWRTALVVGNRSNCNQFVALLTERYPMGYHVIALSSEGDSNALNSAEVEDADEAFILSDAKHGDSYVLSLLKLGKRVHIVPDLLDMRLFRQSLGDVAGIPVVSLLAGRLNRMQAVIKRSADLLGALLLVALLSPLFALLSVLIKCSSKGPVFFRQRRVGKEGKTLTIFKFRTMISNAEQVLKSDPAIYQEYVANNFKLPKGKDPRVTKIGAFLRATSLDELPQLFNVIRGDMSLVGPRPVVPVEVEKYGDYVQLLLSAKPGMTGHWQVSGRSEIEEYAQRVELDMEYIRDQSIRKDLEILLRTVPAVILRKGAY
jgi:exopolysaccharide production protein ExoY